MALLGQGARPAAIDYSSWADSAERLAATQANAFSSVAGAVKDVFEDRKVKKDQIKVSADLLKAYATINPERKDMFAGIAEQLKDEEKPLSERAAFAEQVGSLIGMDQERQKSDRRIAEFAQNYALDLQKANLAQEAGRFELDAAKEDRSLAKQSLADNEEVQSLVAPNVMLNVIQQTQAMEKAGQPVMIPSSQLQQVLQTGTPQQKMALASAAMSAFPQDAPTEFRDVPITIGGQPGTATAAYNRKTGTFDIVPVREAGSVTGLPAGLANYAADFEAAGAKHGVDPKLLAAISMHETGNGTSSAFRTKNNAMGISDSKGPTAQASVPASIDRMASLIGSRTSGPYKDADSIPEIAKIYAPPGAGNDPRGLNKHWVEGVSKYYRDLGGDPSAPVKITPGAVKSTAAAKTPTEQALDEARLKKLGAEVENKEADLAKQTDAKATAKASAENALTLIDQLRKHPGFTSAVGVSLTPGFIPATDRKGAESIIDQLKGQAFLTAIQQLRGLGALSDAEGAKLQQAAVRLDAGQSEKDFMIALSDYEKQIREALGRLGGASAPAPQSAADRLRSRINGQ
jgi:hypothetical protein